MTSLTDVALALVDMAHRIVWATVATVDAQGRPWTRILHPIWQWDGTRLTGWVATSPSSPKRAHLAVHPHAAVTYWDPSQDTANVYCHAELLTDEATRTWLWDTFVAAGGAVGYDPSIIPGWDGPTSPAFAALRLDPWLVRVQPGDVLLKGHGELLQEWRA